MGARLMNGRKTRKRLAHRGKRKTQTAEAVQESPKPKARTKVNPSR